MTILIPNPATKLGRVLTKTMTNTGVIYIARDVQGNLYEVPEERVFVVSDKKEFE